MKTENIISAPRVEGVEDVFEKWKQNHLGTFSGFYRFITTPSAERDEFLKTLHSETGIHGSAVSVTYK